MEPLTANAIFDIHEERTVERPVVQILAVKKINTQAADATKPDRYRVQISDGNYKQPSAMLATQLNELITSQKVKKNSIVRLTKYTCNPVSGKRIIIILAMDILASDVDAMIGNPVTVSKDEDGGDNQTVPGSSAPAAPAAPAHTEAAPAAVSAAPAAARNAYASKPANNPYANRHEQSSTMSAPSASTNMAPRGGAPAGVSHQPITSLNPYNQRWTIRARVTARPPKKTYSNQRGEGRLFSVDLLDESGEIRATGFNETCDKFYDQLEVGKVFFIRGGKLKPANKKFSQINNDYELTFDDSTVIIPDSSADTALPQIKYDFRQLSDLEAMPTENTLVDVIAVVTTVGDTNTFTAKASGKEYSKREITLVDRSLIKIQCTLWGKDADDFTTVHGGAEGVVVAIKKAKLSDFGGRSLSIGQSSTLAVNPDLPQAHELKGWFDSEGATADVKSFARANAGGARDPRIFASQVKESKIGMVDGKAEYFAIKATVSFVKKENCMYKACANENCNKKVIEEGAGSYRCERCSVSSPNFQWRLMLTLSACDHTGQLWLTAFQDAGEEVLGMKTQDLGMLKESDEAAFDQKMFEATFKQWVFKVRAKSDTWNEETRVRLTAMNASPVNYVQESQRLIEEIKNYM